VAVTSALTRVTRHGLVQRVLICNVPIDILPPEQITTVLENLLMAPGAHQIIFLRIPDFMRALRNPEYRACLHAAALVLPVSMGLKTASQKLKLPAPYRYSPFTFAVQMLNVLERVAGSYYILGDQALPLGTIEKNLRQTFPLAQTLGRYVGYFSPAMEQNIVTAVAKAAPNLLLLGPGVPGRNLWPYRNRRVFRRGIQLWCGECFDYFALRQRRPNRVSFRKGREYFHELMIHPWRLAHVPVNLMFRATILFTRLAKPSRSKLAESPGTGGGD
jgi:N-acetylglucosaminyldiphosphoundecaprenol N-acetyl-beta-D-mannosaminyltransferase